ncbi:glutamate ABC transporter substrate-binding protein [Streptoalloteichus hindustanus]|uniref:Amino acid ABC transporter substrate-binding protein, PAAT family n=1 Tax=Streptoalloteichus hindustanus TaxID=2017 RepID=A0A1M5B919_STRHI|nr:glutamate ABC transporter substrate-binding protein [Streptoalloteichus hindustanus]SHF38989.1 amino acid ABC transporter substrate-binding protein, PAAT family [Streptoalloteichus hindustanus]
MRFTRMLRVGAAVAALALAAACGGGGGGTSGKSLAQRAKDTKKLTVGIKFDQPGLGQKTPDGKFEGFDIDVARYVAKQLGVDEGNIEFKKAESAQRENMIEKGEVDYVVGTYSINDKRKEKVSFAGPYFVTGQDLLVRADNTDITGPDALNGKKLCSVKGSTPAQKIKTDFSQQAELQEYGGYSECLTGLSTGKLDALTTDAVILAGYAAQNPGKFKLVGKVFTEEKYGIGLKKGDAEGRDAINKAIEKMISDGAWKASLEKHVGPAGYKIPDPPTVSEK